MFHFAWFASRTYGFSAGWRRVTGAGLLHSETPGSEAACAYPGTIAACRVLRRPLPPRHPSCARTACPQNIRGRAVVHRNFLLFWLLMQSRQSGKDTVKIPDSVSKWAMLMNVSRPSLHRELKKLEEEGIVNYSAGVVKILDSDALQDILSRS